MEEIHFYSKIEPSDILINFRHINLITNQGLVRPSKLDQEV